MTTLSIPHSTSLKQLPFHADSGRVRHLSKPLTFLLFSKDEDFWDRFRAAATRVSGKLIRKHRTVAVSRTLRRFKPAAVLLDLDLPSTAGWEIANLFLQDPNSPPLLLLTSRSEQFDFKAAIDAGLLIDKSEPPDKLVELLDATTQSPGPIRGEKMAMQQLIVRWLKPLNSLSENMPLRRFWGINE